ncbi:MAG: hypothetical protein WBS54_08565 [Acidobacteriota bacterium]
MKIPDCRLKDRMLAFVAAATCCGRSADVNIGRSILPKPPFVAAEGPAAMNRGRYGE